MRTGRLPLSSSDHATRLPRYCALAFSSGVRANSCVALQPVKSRSGSRQKGRPARSAAFFQMTRTRASAFSSPSLFLLASSYQNDSRPGNRQAASFALTLFTMPPKAARSCTARIGQDLAVDLDGSRIPLATGCRSAQFTGSGVDTGDPQLAEHALWCGGHGRHIAQPSSPPFGEWKTLLTATAGNPARGEDL